MRENSPTTDLPDAAEVAACARWLDRVGPAHGVDVTFDEPASSTDPRASARRVGRPPHTAVVVRSGSAQAAARHRWLSQRLCEATIEVPRVLAADDERGWLLLEDFGRDDLRASMRAAADRADSTMRAALATLVRLQSRVDASSLPAAPIDETLAQPPRQDLESGAGRRWSDAETAAWRKIVATLDATAAAQPAVAVHGDFVPRRLRARPHGAIGVLGFAGLHAGPLGDDVAALIGEAAPDDDEARRLDWAVRWWEAARGAGLPVDADFGACWRTIEWLTLRRDLRRLGGIAPAGRCAVDARGNDETAQRLQRAVRVAMRYAPLKPLLRLLEPLGGAGARAGYTF